YLITFRAARSDVMRNAESDNDDAEDYQIKRNKFGAPIYGPKPVPYLNCNDPTERSLAIETSMEEQEVPLVDDVFEGALGALALEMKALVDAMVVDRG
ncbi:hypothetical protein Tco_1206635, partial [Tanacetum coccineum]